MSSREAMYARKAERERRARLEAERVIDSKSLQIYEMNNHLMKVNESLDRRIRERTRELEQAHAQVLSAAAELAEANQRFELVLKASRASVWEVSPDGALVYSSPNIEQVLGFRPEDMVAQGSYLGLIHPDDRRRLRRTVIAALDTCQPFEVECRIRRIDGEYRWFRVSGYGDRNAEGKLQRMVGAMIDVDAQVHHAEVIQRMATVDYLTDIPNRCSFNKQLQRAIEDARKFGEPFVLMLIDLDNFKEVNDTLGHGAGDVVLKEVARRLTDNLKGYDYAARLGGDEFGVILRNVTDRRHVIAICNQLLYMLRKPVACNGSSVEVYASIGITEYDLSTEDAESMLMQADMAMYAAKRRHLREGGCEFYDESFGSDMLRRRHLEQAMKKGIADNEFCLHYQPQSCLATGELIGVEALLRWNNPLQGLMLPSAFIGAAEENGLIIPLGEWVIRKVCEDILHWRQQGLNVRVAVNLSPVQFNHGDIADYLRQQVIRHNIDPGLIELEITESVLVSNIDWTKSVLEILNENGFRISLDDFGSGYSSLTYLHQLPIDMIKIDRSFVEDLMNDEQSRIITRSIINLANSLGLEVLAEGVESWQQLNYLLQEGCHYAQGYLIARPMQSHQLADWITEHRSEYLARRKSGTQTLSLA